MRPYTIRGDARHRKKLRFSRPVNDKETTTGQHRSRLILNKLEAEQRQDDDHDLLLLTLTMKGLHISPKSAYESYRYIKTSKSCRHWLIQMYLVGALAFEGIGLS